MNRAVPSLPSQLIGGVSEKRTKAAAEKLAEHLALTIPGRDLRAFTERERAAMNTLPRRSPARLASEPSLKVYERALALQRGAGIVPITFKVLRTMPGPGRLGPAEQARVARGLALRHTGEDLRALATHARKDATDIRAAMRGASNPLLARRIKVLEYRARVLDQAVRYADEFAITRP
jgi:hypothetical protein